MKRRTRNFGKVAAGQRALLLWKRFIDQNRKPDRQLDGIEFLPQSCEAFLWRCLFCDSTEEETHKPDCILMAAIELVDEVFGNDAPS